MKKILFVISLFAFLALAITMLVFAVNTAGEQVQIGFIVAALTSMGVAVGNIGTLVKGYGYLAASMIGGFAGAIISTILYLGCQCCCC